MPAKTKSIHSEVERQILKLLAKTTPDPRRIDSRIFALSKKLGREVYSDLLHLLCHLRFTPRRAEAHWDAILEHRQKLSEKFGSVVDFRVALLDYFISVNQHFRNPKIIEIKIFQKTSDSALRDELTGLHNYRYFRSELDRELKRAKRSGSSLSLVLFDVDHFKGYNDRHGHLEGDRALKAVARAIQRGARDSDLVARYGGEEFGAILPGVCKPTACAIAERIRARISRERLRAGSGELAAKVSVSGGVATYRADAGDPLALIEAADRALYQAKANGRDRIVSAGTENREFPRIDVELPGMLQVFCRQPERFVTENLSEHGLQLRCGAPLEEREIFQLRITPSQGGSEIQAVARAVRVRKKGAAFVAGAKFVDIAFPHLERLKQHLAAKQNGKARRPARRAALVTS